MATTRNLKLIISSGLTSEARYNLERIDALAGTFLLDTREGVRIRSATDLHLLPEDPSIGGSGEGGSITLGSASQLLTSLAIHAEEISLDDARIIDSFTITDANVEDGLHFVAGAFTASLVPPASLSASYSLSLPEANGSVGQVLALGASNKLEFVNAVGASLAGLSDVTFTSPSSGEVLTYNGSEWVNQNIPGGGQELATTWAAAEGVTKVITHNFGSTDLLVQVYSSTDNSLVSVGVDFTSANAVQLTSIVAPPVAGYRILLKEIT